MMGRTVLPQRTGRPERVTADGYPEWLPVGVTVAWALVDAATTETDLADGTPVYPGEKAIERGTILVPVTGQEVQTVTINGAPTGGSFTLSGVDANGDAFTTDAIAYNASADDLAAALAPFFPNAGDFTVTKAGDVFTVSFSAFLGNLAQLTSTASLTGGTTPSVTHATTTSGVANGGHWAPYDSSASDGRQTLTRGSVGILDYSIKDSESTVMGVDTQTELIGLISGGLVWRERLHTGGTNEPALADLLAAMPRLELTPAE